MKLKDLKKIINNLQESELEQDLIYNSDDKCISGIVIALKKARENLYFTGDDPSPLFTKKQLMEEGFDADEIGGMAVEIPKGRYFMSF